MTFLALAPMAAASPAAAGAAADDDREALDRQREARRALFLEQQQPAQRLESQALTPCVNNLAGTYPCDNVDLLAFMPLSNIGGGNGNDIWGWTDPLTGREYALMGRSSGTSFVDITDPVNPVYLGNLPTHTSNSSWRDIKVYANHAYIVSEALSHGMQIFDLTQLRNVTNPPVTFTETAHYGNFGSAHNIVINEDSGYAYAVGTGTCSGGPHFIDISSPTAPVYAGCHVEPIYTHDAQCVNYIGPDPDHQGKEICVNSNETRINIIDVTDKSNTSLISQTFYAGNGYTHQGWMTEDQVYYLQGDETDEQSFGHTTRTRVFDISDLDNPVLVGNNDGPVAAIDHNLYTLNGYVYEANYRAGLRILDLSQVATGVLPEVAYFDIYPSSNSANFNGAWSVYPYFASGVVVVSGIEQGLFVLRPTLGPSFTLDIDNASATVCDPGSTAVQVTLTERDGYVGDATLSVGNLPAGVTASFSTNPVSVPGSSQLTLDTAGAASGTYGLSIEATDGTLDRTRTFSLQVFAGTPSQPQPLMPVDGAIDVLRLPTLTWSPATDAVDYTLEVATDPGFSALVYSTTLGGTSHRLQTQLQFDTTYFWRVRAGNACGDSTDSPTWSFTTFVVPRILLIDDDDNTPDVRSSYTGALQAMSEEYDVWDTMDTDNEPTAVALAPYQTVIWFTGDNFGGTAGPGGGGESALAAWLDQSGCLLMTSQDYFYDRGLTALMQNHLGVASVDGDVSHVAVAGQGPVFGGLGPYALTFGYSNLTDRIQPAPGAETAFFGSAGNTGIEKDTQIYRAAYLGFGLEALAQPADLQEVLASFLGWCDALGGLDGDGDGTVNSNDCAASDPSRWTLPSTVQGLTVGSGVTDNLAWMPSSDPGAATVTYDLLRSASATDFGAAVCVESGDTDTMASDATAPAPGGLVAWLVRARNACGANMGGDAQRTAPVCP